MNRRVAFQGAAGAYSEEAARLFFGENAETLPFREFREVGDAVLNSAADFGLLPVENTLAGSVLPAYDVLARDGIEVRGEVIMPIRHCLLGLRGTTVQDVRRVLSHPVALAQCERFLLLHQHMLPVAVYDTAGAAQQVAAEADASTAAIAGRHVAEPLGLAVLAADLEDRSDNQTRFLVIAPARQPHRVSTAADQARPNGETAAAGPAQHPSREQPAGTTENAAWRTTILVETDDRPGALVRVLENFSARSINLSKLESRPGTRPWSYRFFIDLDCCGHAPDTAAALADARSRSASLRVLGSYPRWRSATPG